MLSGCKSRWQKRAGAGGVVEWVTTGVRAYILAVVSLCSVAAGFSIGCGDAQADTLEWALVQAYQNNPSLNAQRAALRATDENVPQALSGYRPKLSLTATGGYNYQKRRHRYFRSAARLSRAHSRRPSIRAPSAPTRPTRCSTACRPPTARVRRKAR